MLTPLILLLLKKYQPQESHGTKNPPIPNFVIGFIAFPSLVHWIYCPVFVSEPLKELGKDFLDHFNGGIGLKIYIAKIREYGLCALWVALVLFVIQIGVTILMLVSKSFF